MSALVRSAQVPRNRLSLGEDLSVVKVEDRHLSLRVLSLGLILSELGECDELVVIVSVIELHDESDEDSSSMESEVFKLHFFYLEYLALLF